MRDLRASQPQASQRAQSIYRAFLISALPLAAQQGNPLKAWLCLIRALLALRPLLYWADAAGTAGLPCCTAAEVGHLGIAIHSLMSIFTHPMCYSIRQSFKQRTQLYSMFSKNCYCSLCNDVKLCNSIRLSRPRRDHNKKHMGICIDARAQHRAIRSPSTPSYEQRPGPGSLSAAPPKPIRRHGRSVLSFSFQLLLRSPLPDPCKNYGVASPLLLGQGCLLHYDCT